MKRVVIGVFLALIGLLIFNELRGRRERAVSAIGSTSIQPFAEMLAQEFNRRHPDCHVEVQGGGSTAGLQAASEGIADIGMCSRSLKEDRATPDEPAEAEVFTPIVIARDGLAIVVHPSNPVSSLTREQVRRLFAQGSSYTRWKDVGGLDAPVRLITREEGSGTREAFAKMVMGKSRISRKALTQESNGAVKELVKHDPCAIGYMSLGLIGDDLKALRIDGHLPTLESVTDGTYPLVRPFLFVSRGPPSPQARRFIDFVLAGEGQRMLEEEGLVRAK